jgi:hypothetical protein
MADDLETETVEGDQNPSSPPPAESDDNNVDPKVTAFIKQWTSRIKAAKKHYEKAFEQMDECMQLAKDGASKKWATNKDNYIVPILNRLTNQSVAQLYARDPTAYSKRKKRRMFKVWDGTQASLSEAQGMLKATIQQNAQAAQQAIAAGQPAPPPQLPDPNAMAIIQDAETVKTYNLMMDGLADTLTILQQHFFTESVAMYKQQFKALVRRAKICGVGYVKLCFQRQLEKQPDITAKISDATEQLMMLERLQAEAKEPDFDKDGADAEQLKTLLADLQSQEYLVVNEGPVYAFPKSKAIIIDPACKQLKTLVGASWTAEEFDKTPDEIQEDYGIDIKGQYTEYKSDTEANWDRWSDESGKMERVAPAKVWRVMNRKTGQEFTICEGYKDYLKPPAPPVVKIPRFFDIFPLVFNEIESDDDLYPPSDVWLARHLQDEYNRSRQGLREHRMQNRPGYIAPNGAFDEGDLNKLESHPSGAIITLNGLAPGSDIRQQLMAKPVMEIVPEQYDVKEIYSDILLVTGDQQANVGPTTNATATESSIAEQSRGVGLSDNVDDIDDLLGELTQSTGIVMLQNLTLQTVQEIVGPGAVWPQIPQTREEYAEEVILDVKAGSMGRPNAAAELQKLQQAMSVIMQMPNINPIPLEQKYMDLLDIDAEDSIVEGLPSMQAMNQIASSPPPPPPPQGAGQPPAQAPAAQGLQGGNNAPRPPGLTPGPLAAHPVPVPGGLKATGA